MPMERERGSLALRHPDDRITFDRRAIFALAYQRAAYGLRFCRNVGERRAILSWALKAAWQAAKVEAGSHRITIENEAYARRAIAATASAHIATAARYGNDRERIAADLLSEEMSDRPDRGVVASLQAALVVIIKRKGGANT